MAIAQRLVPEVVVLVNESALMVLLFTTAPAVDMEFRKIPIPANNVLATAVFVVWDVRLLMLL